MMIAEKKKKKEERNLVVTIADLERGPMTLDCTLSLDWLKERMSFCEYDAAPSRAALTLNLQSSGGGIWIRGNVTAMIETQCGSCLSDLSIEIHSAIHSYLLPLAEYKKDLEKDELTPEDLDREYYDGETIALDDMVGDAIMLELPMNPKCESSCAGLKEFAEIRKVSAPSIDPRLAPLMGIRINKEN
jgi:uncharacterized protein